MKIYHKIIERILFCLFSNIMHHTSRIVGSRHIEPFSHVQLHEVRLNTLLDIVPFDLDVLVAVGARLRVEES